MLRLNRLFVGTGLEVIVICFSDRRSCIGNAVVNGLEVDVLEPAAEGVDIQGTHSSLQRDPGRASPWQRRGGLSSGTCRESVRRKRNMSRWMDLLVLLDGEAGREGIRIIGTDYVRMPV